MSLQAANALQRSRISPGCRNRGRRHRQKISASEKVKAALLYSCGCLATPFSITFKIRATPASFLARAPRWKSAIPFAATSCNSRCASKATASRKRVFFAEAALLRLPALRSSRNNCTTVHSRRRARSPPSPFRKGSAGFPRRHFTAPNLPPVRLQQCCEISQRNIDNYSARPVARRSVSGSFRFKMQPSSLVDTSRTSSACAQTTARAPLSAGARSNSS
jgi:hypothetical protein